MQERILFDFTYYQKSNVFHGGGEYGNVILRKLLSKDLSGCGLFFNKYKYVDMVLVNAAIKKGWNIHPICDLRNIPSIVKQFGYTTVYSALPYSPMWSKVNLPVNVRFIGTFHGLREIETALYCESEQNFNENQDKSMTDFLYQSGGETEDAAIQRYSKALLAFQNKKIITVSEHSKYSMHRYFPEIKLSDIIVLYSPEKNTTPMDNREFEYTFLNRIGVSDKNFGLIVSAAIWLKNGLRGIMAYDALFDKEYSEIPKTYKVVVTGVKNTEQLSLRLKHKERFILLGYVEENELETLYKHAQLLVYPSLNEGFGYPPLEAMKYGTLCACSANTSISEICRDMTLIFNPFLIGEISVRILQSFSPEIRNEKMQCIEDRLPQIQKRQQKDLNKLIDILMGE